MIFFTDLVIGEIDDNSEFELQIKQAVELYKSGKLKKQVLPGETKNVFYYDTCLGQVEIVKDGDENLTILFKNERCLKNEYEKDIK
jgi:hypothetical protein